MSTPTPSHQSDLYEIRVRGHLESRRLRPYEDLTMTHQANGETVLHAPIFDQAVLYGILNRLRDLGIPLLSVNPISNADEDRVTEMEGDRQ